MLACDEHNSSLIIVHVHITLHMHAKKISSFQPSNKHDNVYTIIPGSRYGHLDVVSYLVTEAHCDPNVGNNYGWTPLHQASR